MLGSSFTLGGRQPPWVDGYDPVGVQVSARRIAALGVSLQRVAASGGYIEHQPTYSRHAKKSSGLT